MGNSGIGYGEISPLRCPTCTCITRSVIRLGEGEVTVLMRLSGGVLCYRESRCANDCRVCRVFEQY